MAARSEPSKQRPSQELSSNTDVSTNDMERTPSKTEKGAEGELPPAVEEVSAAETDPILDRSLQAYLQVFGGFFLFFNSWGIVNTFGVFQTYYQQNLLSSSTPDAISWIGSIQSFLLLGSGGIAGPLFDAGYLTPLISFGSFLICLGFMMTSLGSEYWHILLSQGFCIGIGAGCMVVPVLAIIPQYFTPGKRALVAGICVTGSSVGGVVYPLLFTALVSRIGFAWASRTLGFIAAATCGAAVAVMRTRGKPRKVRSLFDPKSFREPPYLWFCAAMFCSNFGFFVPVFYLQTYALGHGMADERDLALNLVAILNAASILGRLAPSLVVRRVGPINTMFLVAFMAGAVTFCWAAVNDTAGNIAFAVLFGFSSGGIVSLPAVVLASVTDDLAFMGARLGTANLFNALGSLCGPPIAGAILRAQGETNYLGLQLFAAFAIGGTSVCLYGMRIARAGPGLLVRV